MTLLVTPIKPFRAWQYRKDSTEPVPEWVDATGIRSGHVTHGAWIVDYAGAGSCWYTPAEFQEQFRLEPKVYTSTDPASADGDEAVTLFYTINDKGDIEVLSSESEEVTE
jgi:hypothetical protein